MLIVVIIILLLNVVHGKIFQQTPPPNITLLSYHYHRHEIMKFRIDFHKGTIIQVDIHLQYQSKSNPTSSGISAWKSLPNIDGCTSITIQRPVSQHGHHEISYLKNISSCWTCANDIGQSIRYRLIMITPSVSSSGDYQCVTQSDIPIECSPSQPTQSTTWITIQSYHANHYSNCIKQNTQNIQKQYNQSSLVNISVISTTTTTPMKTETSQAVIKQMTQSNSQILSHVYFNETLSKILPIHHSLYLIIIIIILILVIIILLLCNICSYSESRQRKEKRPVMWSLSHETQIQSRVILLAETEDAFESQIIYQSVVNTS